MSIPQRPRIYKRANASTPFLPKGRRRCFVTIDETIAPVVAVRDCVNLDYVPAEERERLPARASLRTLAKVAREAVSDAATWDALTGEVQEAHGQLLLSGGLHWDSLTIHEKARAASLFAQWEPRRGKDGMELCYRLRSPRSSTTYRLEFCPSLPGMRCDCPAGLRGANCYHVLMFPAEWLDEIMGELVALSDRAHEAFLSEQERETFVFESRQYGVMEPMHDLRSNEDWG